MSTIQGTIIKINPKQFGASQTGKTWVKKEFVIETQDQYPKKVLITLKNEKIIGFFEDFREGQKCEISYNLESREYNQKFYTEVIGWKITRL